MKTALATLLSTVLLATTALAPIANAASPASQTADDARAHAQVLIQDFDRNISTLVDQPSTPAQQAAARAWLVAHEPEARDLATSLDGFARKQRIIGWAIVGATGVAQSAAFVYTAGLAYFASCLGAGVLYNVGFSGVRTARALNSLAQQLRDEVEIGGLVDHDVTAGGNASRNAPTSGAVATIAPSTSSGGNTGFRH